MSWQTTTAAILALPAGQPAPGAGPAAGGWWWWAVVAALVVALLVWSAWLPRRRDRPPR